MRSRRAAVLLRSLVCLILPAVPLAAQRTDSVSRPAGIPQAAFVGFIKNALDKSSVRSADIRLYLIDSTRAVRDTADLRESFVDTLRSRLAVSDSAGYFAVWHLAAGRYLMNVRRIGYEPQQALITVDSETVLYEFTMQPLSQALAKVEIKENALPNVIARRLERSGFNTRKNFEAGYFYKPDDFMKYRPMTLRDILSRYHLHDDAEYMLDRMPVDYMDLMEYPAELIAGVEVYNHNRPIQFNMTRSAPTVLQSGGVLRSRPLVLIWTY